jgi:hypothetical protein
MHPSRAVREEAPGRSLGSLFVVALPHARLAVLYLPLLLFAAPAFDDRPQTLPLGPHHEHIQLIQLFLILLLLVD